jgi:hypothetical protein
MSEFDGREVAEDDAARRGVSGCFTWQREDIQGESTDPFIIFAANSNNPASFVDFTTAGNGRAS